MTPAIIGFSVVFLILIYTIYLIRSYQLSAHMAISWLLAEVAFLVILISSSMRSSIRAFLGDESAMYSMVLFGAVWVIFLMLESLTRISSLTSKLKDINQQLALTKERLDRAEQLIHVKFSDA